jgi:hypothetical protein
MWIKRLWRSHLLGRHQAAALLVRVIGNSDAVLAALYGASADKHWHRHFCIGGMVSCGDVTAVWSHCGCCRLLNGSGSSALYGPGVVVAWCVIGDWLGMVRVEGNCRIVVLVASLVRLAILAVGCRIRIKQFACFISSPTTSPHGVLLFCQLPICFQCLLAGI